MKKYFTYLCSLSLVCLLACSSALALDLDSAKAQGLVGETVGGYLAPVSSSPTPEVASLVATINQQRKEKYQQIASSNQAALSAVETLAGKKAIDNTQSGNYIQGSDGRWIKK